MSKFKETVEKVLMSIDYEYVDGKFVMNYQEVLNLLEHMVFESIYNPELRNEVFLDKAQ